MEEAKKTLTLPITGMTCANCVAAVERNLNKLDGVQSANVNLASERASVEFDPAKVDQKDIKDIIARIKRTGYDIALGEADFVLKRLGDVNDARRLEEALLGTDGVVGAPHYGF